MNTKMKLIVISPFVIKTKREKKKYKANDTLEVSQELYKEIKNYVKPVNSAKKETVEE